MLFDKGYIFYILYLQFCKRPKTQLQLCEIISKNNKSSFESKEKKNLTLMLYVQNLLENVLHLVVCPGSGVYLM